VIWGLKGNTKPLFLLSLPVKETTPNCSPVFNWLLGVTVPKRQSIFPGVVLPHPKQ